MVKRSVPLWQRSHLPRTSLQVARRRVCKSAIEISVYVLFTGWEAFDVGSYSKQFLPMRTVVGRSLSGD